MERAEKCQPKRRGNFSRKQMEPRIELGQPWRRTRAWVVGVGSGDTSPQGEEETMANGEREREDSRREAFGPAVSAMLTKGNQSQVRWSARCPDW